MCLLIVAHNKVQNLEWLSNGFDNNSHGAGFVYAHEKKLHVRKGFFTFDKFAKAYAEMPDAPCLIHFRLATGGKLNEENCHPFNVTNNLAFAHNGVFFNINSCDKYSDTYHFNELIVKPVFAKNPHAIFTPAAKILLEEFIGHGNKLAFLDNKGKIAIMNEQMGDYEDNIWFSNASYKYGRKGLCKSGRTTKVYSSSSPDKFNAVSHPTLKDWLTDAFLDYKAAQEDKLETQLEEEQKMRDKEMEDYMSLHGVID